MPDEAIHAERRRAGLKFDPTFNVGNIIAIMGAIGAVATSWVALNTRMTIVETTVLAQDDRIKENKKSIHRQEEIVRDTVKEIDRKLERIYERVK